MTEVEVFLKQRSFPFLLEANPIELSPNHQLFDDYVALRIKGIHEVLSRFENEEYLLEEIEYLVIRYIQLELLTARNPGEEMEFTVLSAISVGEFKIQWQQTLQTYRSAQ